MRKPSLIMSWSILLTLAVAAPTSTLAQALKLYWADEFAGRVYKSDPGRDQPRDADHR